jgi:hypothetical protein
MPSNEPVSQVGNDTSTGERRINQRVVLVDAVDGSILLTQIAHVVVGAGMTGRQSHGFRAKG